MPADALPVLGAQMPATFSLTGVVIFLTLFAAVMTVLVWGLCSPTTTEPIDPFTGAGALLVEARRPRRYARRHAAANRKRAA